MAAKIALGALPIPSTAKTSDVGLQTNGSTLTLSFTFNREKVTHLGGVRFDEVRAHRWRAERYCTAWHIEGPYDTVMEVTDSDWVNELREAESDRTRDGEGWVLRHYMLYVDSDGCFEVVGESWSFLTDELPS